MRGGKRAGAGRPKGSKSNAQRKISVTSKARTIELRPDDPLPIEVILSGMLFHYAKANSLIARGELEDDEKQELRAELNLAVSFAAQAAPYVHPRLAQVDQSITHGVTDALADLLTEIDSKTRGVPSVGNGISPVQTSH